MIAKLGKMPATSCCRSLLLAVPQQSKPLALSRIDLLIQVSLSQTQLRERRIEALPPFSHSIFKSI
jgi:hypothetical protein